MDVLDRIGKLTPDQRTLLTHRLKAMPGTLPGRADGGAVRLVAHVVARQGKEPPAAEDLRRHVSERLPAFMVPSAFVPIDVLPVLPNGKVDRQALSTRTSPTVTRSSGAVPSDAVEAQLMRIWDDLIDLPDIGRDDNFFELGGHSLLVPRLIDRVQRDFGVTLPLGSVFQTPTVKGLAEIIRAGNPAHSWRSLVGIREGGRRPPLYLVHGLGGEIGYFYNLAEYLNHDQPVFGLQAPVEPLGEIEAMASHYLEEIRSHQPHGPYLLGGYCVGGCVAFEMAQQLVRAGESVRLLAIVDAVMPGPQSIARQLKRFASRSPREMVATVLARIRHYVQGFEEESGSQTQPGPALLNSPRVFHAAAAKHYRAQANYAPRPYQGDMWLFRSRDNAFDEDLGWGPLVRGRLQVRTIPGRHADVLKEPHLEETARQLSAAVEAAAMSGA